MELQPCVRCGKGLKAPQGINTTGDKAIAIYITVVTVGMRPRQISKAKRSVLCVPCGISIAMAPAPDGAFNQTVYEALNDLNSRDMTIIEAAWEQKQNPLARPRLMPGSKPDQSLTTPILKSPALSAAS